jgi:hypothetical protein
MLQCNFGAHVVFLDGRYANDGPTLGKHDQTL